MNIIYVYSNCSKHKYEELVERTGIMVLPQAQKYHSLMIHGLKENNVNISVVSSLPINRKVSNKLYHKNEYEYEDNVKYCYPTFINMPLFRQTMLVVNSFRAVKKLISENPDSVIVGDPLNLSVAIGSIAAAKLCKRKSTAIITDLPQIDKGLLSFMNKHMTDKYDSYLLLTKQMNEIVNRHNRPYVVVEGQCDINERCSISEEKYSVKTVIYAGSVHRKYGIDRFAEAFLKANIDNSQLVVYGDGDYADELKKIAYINPKMKYEGFKPNDYIIKQLKKAILLVNPRPSDAEYTKYSFPSKNMEYMVSGTPLLTTDLPGIPEEYRDYVYLFDDESVHGMASKIKEILTKPLIELNEKGHKSREFVLANKNNIVQAAKLINMINDQRR